ncbi:hypothetical protein KAR91_52235 [Candidatus Pacearchaeota archaeon]|nr:hypothetical protein [Candidatus Pacearchaeota archaeon]
MRTSITVKTEQSNKNAMKQIVKRLEKLKDKSLSVGFFSNSQYPDGTPVASVAMWNNNGTDRIPERPFFTKGILIGQMSGRAISKELIGDLVLGEITQKFYLNAMGSTYQDAIVQAIDSNIAPPNESRYWERKMLKGLKSSGKKKFKKRKAEGKDYLDILKEMDEKYTSGKSEGKYKYKTGGGGSPKTLINQGIMRKAVSYRVG